MTTTPKDFVLMHIDPNYDAQKAHEYYIRTRKLKGRKRGVKKLTGDLANENANTVVRPELRGKFIPKGTPKAGLVTTERQAQVEARVKALQGKLQLLEAVLRKLLSEAQGSSTTKKRTKSATPGSKKTAATSKRKELTAAQKSDKAKKAKAAYKKAHPNSASAQKKERAKKIEEVKAQIKQVKADLKAALERARQDIAKPKLAAASRQSS